MRIFVSYRRSDSRTVTGRLWQYLCGEIGRDNIFFDHDSLPPGLDFPSQIATAVRQSQVVLVMIGPNWVTTTRDGLQRLGLPDDHVRREVELALEHVEVVVPVLVDGAGVPEPNQLPESLRPLVNRTAVQLRDDPDFLPDAERLIARLRRAAGDTVPDTPAAAHGSLAEQCRTAGQAGRWEECLDLARRLLEPARGSSVEDVEEAAGWLLFGRRWDELADLLPAALAGAADDPGVRSRGRLVALRTAQAVGDDVEVAELAELVDTLRRVAGSSAPVTTRARTQLALGLVWSDDSAARGATMLGELADDIVHSYRTDRFGAVWERLWLLTGVVRNDDPQVRQAALRLASATEADARALGSGHPLAALATLLRAWLTDTDPDTGQLVSTVVRQVGRNHPGYAWLLGTDAARLEAAGDFAAAAGSRTRLVGWLEEAFGPSHPSTLTGLSLLVAAQNQAGLQGDAVRTATSLLTRNQAIDPGSAATLDAAWELGWALAHDGQPQHGLAVVTGALAASRTAHDDDARLNAEVASLQFADRAGDHAGVVERADLLLASRSPGEFADWVIPYAHRAARNALEATDRIEEALHHAVALQPAVDQALDATMALDILALAGLRFQADENGAALELLDGVWPDLDRSLPSGELRIHAALLRETVRCLDDEPDSDALLAAVEACAERPVAEYDQCTPLAAQIALLGVLLLAEFELAPRLSAGGIAAATDRMIDALPGSWVPGARLAEAASRSDDLVPCLTRLLEALPAEPEPVTGRELSGTLSLLRARLAWETQNWYRWADGTDPLPPLRDAVQPEKLLDRITQVWNDQPDAETDPQDLAELTRLWTYRHLTHGDWPAEATRTLARRLAELQDRFEVGGTLRGRWDVPLPADRQGRRLVADAALGYALALLRSRPSTGTDRRRFGAELFAVTVLRLDATGGHLLGDGSWLGVLGDAVPAPVRSRLLRIDAEFAGLAERGSAGWLGEEVPDLFATAPVRDQPWQQSAQRLFEHWAERKFAELPDPYGRYQDGSWPVPPPAGDLPPAYAELAAKLLAAANESLFG